MLLTVSSKDVSKGQCIVILIVSLYLVIKLTRYRVFRIVWYAPVLYFERYGFELGSERSIVIKVSWFSSLNLGKF